MDLSVVPLVTTRRLDVVPGAVWIEPGAPVRAHLSAAGTLRVEAYDGEFVAVAADAPCGTVRVGVAHATPLRRPSTAMQVHAAGLVLHLYPSPDAGPPIELRPETCTPGLFVAEERGAWRRIEYGYGLRVSGWVRARDLAPGQAFDCDDRHGSMRDGYDVDPLPEGVRGVTLVAPAPLFARPERDALVVGDAPSGARILVQDVGGGWVRVWPESFGVLPVRSSRGEWLPGGFGLWTRTPDLHRSTPFVVER
jgi:hypothetical protein